jgi:hypothetical protein
MCDGNACDEVMTMNQGYGAKAPQANPKKDTSEWVTGDEPMTGPQSSYLQTLAQEAEREVPQSLSKAQASELIDELQRQAGRGTAVSFDN